MSTNKSIKHVQYRMQQRYHINITKGDVDEMTRRVENGRAQFVAGNVLRLDYKSKQVLVCFDMQARIIRTVLHPKTKRVRGCLIK